MKQFLILTLLALVALIGTAHANPQNYTPHDFISQALNSVCHIKIIEDDTVVGSGSGFVVETSETVTKIITARHVAENSSKLGVVLNGKSYITSEYFVVFNTDAAMLFVKPGIPHAVALEFNLNSNTDITAVNAFGFWGTSRIPGTAQRLTMTTGWADRKVIDRYSAPDFKVIEGLIMGNVLLYPGYSGGPILDNQMRVIGINILLSQRGTTFVDSRFVWNKIANLNKGNKVKVPFDFSYNLLNIPTHKRVAVAGEDKIRNGADEVTFNEFQARLAMDITTNGEHLLVFCVMG
jgi:S1-C subfamily serine protease